jgi:hypothetical protein
VDGLGVARGAPEAGAAEVITSWGHDR